MVSSPRAVLLLFFVILPIASDAFKCSQNKLKITGNVIQDVPLAQKDVVNCKIACLSWIEVISDNEAILRTGCSDQYDEPDGKPLKLCNSKHGFPSILNETHSFSICSKNCLAGTCHSDFCNDRDQTFLEKNYYNSKIHHHCKHFPKYTYLPVNASKPTERPGALSGGSDAKSGSSSAPTSSGQGRFSMMKMSLIYGGMAFLMVALFGLN